MNSIKNKIIAILFLIIIFLFGSGTLLKCTSDFKSIIHSTGILHCKAEIENSIQENFKSKNNWININGLFQKCLGVTIIRESDGTDVYRLNNGQLMYSIAEKNMKDYAESIEELYRNVKKDNIDFLYVQLPFKIENDSVMPVGCKDYGNKNADKLIEYLSEKNVPYLDIRDSIKTAGYDYDSLFFKTDHHWKPSTAFWAAGIIAENLEEKYNFEIDQDKYDIKNYTIKTYKDWFLGSMGKRTGVWYGGTDDFDVIIPNFETDFDFDAYSSSGLEERNGDFENTMYKWEYINKKDYFNINTYAGYIGGDYKMNIIENYMATNDKNILLVRDSYSCAMAPFLTFAAKNLTTIDLRHYNEQSLIEHIRKNNYDIVIIAYNPSAFTEAQFTFN